MIWRETGEVVPGFHVLGSWQTPAYLWAGPRPVLFDAGLSCLGRRYAEHARRVLGERPPEILFLTHAHFDHCGAASVLRDAFPGLRIAASEQTAEIVQRPGALALIRKLNEEARVRALATEVDPPTSPGFRPFPVDTILAGGDEISLGDGRVVRVLATPGHTRDFLSYYLPGPKVLVASEAVGCANVSGDIVVEFVANYDAYLASMHRLCDLDIEVLCQGHLYVCVGQDARDHLGRSIRATERYRAWVEGLLDEEHGDVERVVARVKTAQWDPAIEPKQPAAAYLLNTQARVRHLAARPRA
ncbi:MAG: MBL fold metallo-hydrolase [Deferrisomatales bacterium]|nr:MBL fold metallo-hydrolase [Deferrisomatales bacterium]